MRAAILLTILALVEFTATAQARPRAVDDRALRDTSKTEWLTYGHDYAETHFSSLNQITDQNVSGLAPAWTYDIGTTGALEATPLISNGILYGTATWDVIFAIDARTGKEKWRWDPQLPRTGGPRLCCGPVNRGVALYHGKVFAGLLDGRLVALDAETGKLAWETQTSVDLKESYSITGAPRVVKGKVIIGNGGAENAVRGYVSAYDAENGKLAWRFFTVPGDPGKPFEHSELAKAAKTWSGEWWKYGGGGTVWDAITYDPDADLLYIGTGNGGPWDRNFRSPGGGDNLFLACILALRPDTGKLVWYFQENPGEMWDYTAVQPIILADLKINGKTRKVLMQAPKNGFFYVIDRTNGQFISAKTYSKVTWALGLDEKTGRPIEAKEARYGKDLTLLYPGPPGAHNWQPMSYNPALGLVYFPAQIVGFEYGADPDYKYNKGGRNLGVIARPGALPRVPGETPPATSFLLAWDPVAQKERWRVDYTGGVSSGTLATAGNLVFQAAGDGRFFAYSADKGSKLWETKIGPGAASPVTYELDGKQYISILSGRGGDNGVPARVSTFALDR